MVVRKCVKCGLIIGCFYLDNEISCSDCKECLIDFECVDRAVGGFCKKCRSSEVQNEK